MVIIDHFSVVWLLIPLGLVLGLAWRMARMGMRIKAKPTTPAPDTTGGAEPRRDESGEANDRKPSTPIRREYAGDPRSIGSHLAIEPGDLAVHFESAAKAIHAVHGDGGLPTIPARKNAKLRKTEAEYFYLSAQPKAITLRPGTRYPAFNVVHEIGHFIDHQALGSKGYDFASVAGYPAAKRVMEAIHRAPQFRALEKELGRTKSKDVKRYLGDLKKPDELFARAYTQYIATRGRDPEILPALRYEQRLHYGKIAYWDEATFEPIAKLFEAMFREIGWSHD